MTADEAAARVVAVWLAKADRSLQAARDELAAAIVEAEQFIRAMKTLLTPAGPT